MNLLSQHRTADQMLRRFYLPSMKLKPALIGIRTAESWSAEPLHELQDVKDFVSQIRAVSKHMQWPTAFLFTSLWRPNLIQGNGIFSVYNDSGGQKVSTQHTGIVQRLRQGTSIHYSKQESNALNRSKNTTQKIFHGQDYSVLCIQKALLVLKGNIKTLLYSNPGTFPLKLWTQFVLFWCCLQASTTGHCLLVLIKDCSFSRYIRLALLKPSWKTCPPEFSSLTYQPW